MSLAVQLWPKRLGPRRHASLLQLEKRQHILDHKTCTWRETLFFPHSLPLPPRKLDALLIEHASVNLGLHVEKALVAWLSPSIVHDAALCNARVVKELNLVLLLSSPHHPHTMWEEIDWYFWSLPSFIFISSLQLSRCKEATVLWIPPTRLLQGFHKNGSFHKIGIHRHESSALQWHGDASQSVASWKGVESFCRYEILLLAYQ